MNTPLKKTFYALLLLSLSAASHAFEYTNADIEINAEDYSGISDVNRWFNVGNDGALYTAWANQWLEFSTNLSVGEWNIGINAQNQGNLGTDWYDNFQVLNSLTNEVIIIDASQTEVNNGYVTANIVNEALYTVRFTWLNDQYDPGQGLDANIRINNAFFDNTSTGVPAPLPLALMALGLLGMGLRGGRAKNQG